MKRAAETNCSYCGEDLDAEELRNPRRDEAKAVMCDQCYDRHYMDYCSRCDEMVEKDELACKPGQLIVIWSEAPACGQDDLKPGYYEVRRWPFYADGMVEGYFFGNALERFGDLDYTGHRCADNNGGLSGAMCGRCQKEVRRVYRSSTRSKKA